LRSRSAATTQAERQLAAVVAADIVGYSRLMGADEEGTLARLKACRHKLKARGTAAFSSSARTSNIAVSLACQLDHG